MDVAGEADERADEGAGEGVDVAGAKAAERRVARARRRELVSGRDLGADGGRLARHVLALVAGRSGGRPGRVAVYASYGVEPPTGRLVEALVAGHHEVLLPRLLPDRSLDWAVPGALDSEEGLGVEALARALVVVTPGLAVDTSGTRLGQGGGSYDRALVHRHPDALVVTLLHDGELREAGRLLPRSALDVPVDGVVTADRGFVDLRHRLTRRRPGRQPPCP